MLTKKEKLHFLALLEESDRRFGGIATASEEEHDSAISTIADTELRFKIDELVGKVILEHSFRGYEIGRAERRIFRGWAK